ncbi:MAG TPA: ATP-binding protein [Thermoanaerobaculia bacterium]|nr:ATP-binding protein [Thermoanaerobaculia bacterium]
MSTPGKARLRHHARRRLAAALTRERERLRHIVSSVPGVVWEAWGEPDAASQRIDFVSGHVETMLGYTVEEWLSTPNFWLTIVHPDDREEASRTAADHWMRGGTGTNRFRWLTKDGRAIWVEGHATVLQDEHGRSIGMRGATFDITPRKRAEESLRLLSEASEILASSLDCAVTLQALVELVAQRIGVACRIDVAAEDGSIANVIGACDDANAATAPLLARGRHFGSVTIGNRTIDDLDRELLQLLARRVAVALDNAQLYRAAVDASNAKDDFLATVSHELRTPMTATLGWVRMLQRGGLDPETQRVALEAIDRSTRAQAHLIDDILDVARIIKGKFQIEPVPVDLPHVIHSAIAALEPAMTAKQMRVSIDTAGWEGMVRGEPERLQQVVWNVMANAIKFGHAEGQIDVRLRRDAATARLTIRDDGAGIDPKFLPRVFDRFQQAEHGTKRTYGGLGLGLAIVRHLVELHGGNVRADSDGHGKGATFTIELPAADFVLPSPPST